MKSSPVSRLGGSVATGIAFMLTASVLLAGLDAVAKYLGSEYPTTELVWFRYAVHLGLALAILLPRRGRTIFRTRVPVQQGARSLLLLGTTVLFFVSLRYLPLAETAAITFSSPLITLALAGPVLGERVNALRIATVLLGFGGVVAVIQPLSPHVTPAVLLPVGAATTASLYAILTRMIGPSEDAGTTWVYTGLAGGVLMLGFAPFGWQTPDLQGALLLLGLGVFGGFGHLALINAYARADATLLAPLGYLELAWATLMGIWLFAEIPNQLALVGIAVIAASGILIAHAGRRTATLVQTER